jgi:hypothetical protein
MPKVKSYRYTGILAAPYKGPRLSSGAQDDAQLDDAFNERWLALCGDCEVSPDNPDAPRQIALKLAFRHVPGFKRLLVGPGPTKHSWETVTQDYLIFTQMDNKIQSGQSIRQAAKNLSIQKPDFGTETALETRYRRVQRKNRNDPAFRANYGEILEYMATEQLKKVIEDIRTPEEEKTKARGTLRSLEAEKSFDARLNILRRFFPIANNRRGKN